MRSVKATLGRVSSHAPARGHPALRRRLCRSPYSFKSCPREGASRERLKQSGITLVSSHAPARGHHMRLSLCAASAVVSSHAPARGHRSALALTWCCSWFQVMPPRGGIRLSRPPTYNRQTCFKSCPREGASGRLLLQQAVVTHVSSHAPARGHHFIRGGYMLSNQFQVMPPRGGILP